MPDHKIGTTYEERRCLMEFPQLLSKQLELSIIQGLLDNTVLLCRTRSLSSTAIVNLRYKYNNLISRWSIPHNIHIDPVLGSKDVSKWIGAIQCRVRQLQPIRPTCFLAAIRIYY